MIIHKTLLPIHTPDFQKGYDKGRACYLAGEAELEPDEEYLIKNLICLYEDGGFTDTSLLRWHIGYLMGMISALTL